MLRYGEIVYICNFYRHGLTVGHSPFASPQSYRLGEQTLETATIKRIARDLNRQLVYSISPTQFPEYYPPLIRIHVIHLSSALVLLPHLDPQMPTHRLPTGSTGDKA
jgi:hypothetical protein